MYAASLKKVQEISVSTQYNGTDYEADASGEYVYGNGRYEKHSELTKYTQNINIKKDTPFGMSLTNNLLFNC